MNFIKAREYLQEQRVIFAKTMNPEMKEALEAADLALTRCIVQEMNVAYIPPDYLKDIK
jgi:hypothetical protein